MKPFINICGISATGLKDSNIDLLKIWRLFSIVFLLFFSSFAYSQEFKNILLLSSKSGGVYQSFIESFIEAYNKTHHQYAVDKIKTLSLEDSLLAEFNWTLNNTIIVTVGSKAAKYVSTKKLEAPVIYAMLPHSVYQKIKTKKESCEKNTAVFIDQPILRQINLSKFLFPRLKSYGVFLGKISKKRYVTEKVSGAFQRKKIHTISINKSRELAWSLRSLSEKANVFIAVNDPLVFNPNNAKWLLYMAYQEKIPVIGFSRPYVFAGAAAAVYSTPAQFGRQAAELLLKQQQKNTRCLSNPQYPVYFNVSVNKAVTQSLLGKPYSEKNLQQRLQQKEREGTNAKTLE